MENTTISRGNFTRKNYSHAVRKQPNQITFSSDKKDDVVLQSSPATLNQPKEGSEAKQNKRIGRKIVDAATVTLYGLFIAAAVYMRHNKSALEKGSEKINALTKAKNQALQDIDHKAKLITGEHEKGNWIFNLFDKFGKLKENSAELTNNLIYGFGTLVVMPLVILFSPFGKKDATKEDRTFTLARQPISFATVFALQYTFEKITKSLVQEMNKYSLLEGTKSTKGKKGNEIEKSIICRREDAFANMRNFFKDQIDTPKKGVRSFSFAQDEFEKEASNIKKIIGLKPEEELKNEFRLKKFMAVIDKYAGIEGKNKNFKNVSALLADYIKESPKVLVDHVDNLVFAGTRSRALKELLAVGANSIFSQALGIMMLNFVYGKMMKKYAESKQNKTEQIKQELVKKDPEALKGGQK